MPYKAKCRAKHQPKDLTHLSKQIRSLTTKAILNTVHLSVSQLFHYAGQ